MADAHHGHSDDELLEDAIPIEMIEDEEDELTPIEIEPLDEAAEESGGEAEMGAGGSAADPYSAAPPGAAKSSKIRMLTERKPHDEHWDRTPNLTHQGAIHVKTFVTKLRLDAIEHMDEQVNNWLDAHPEYEVKFVSQSIGKLVGKNTEDALFMSVWV
ncbi:MAG: hypothetical protein AAGB29_07405 [Planctomycetota bacterium]